MGCPKDDRRKEGMTLLDVRLTRRTESRSTHEEARLTEARTCLSLKKLNLAIEKEQP